MIGLPGDSGEIIDKRVIVNGQALADDKGIFKDSRVQTEGPRDNFRPVTVLRIHFSPWVITAIIVMTVGSGVLSIIVTLKARLLSCIGRGIGKMRAGTGLLVLSGSSE